MLLTGLTLLTGSVANSAGPDFAGEVLPLLKARCVKCHGPGERKAKLSLATPKGLARGGESGPTVVPGKPEESLIWERVEADEMPPKDPLSPAEKATLKRWLEAGAPGLPTVSPGEPEGSDHWAFARLSRPAVPTIRDPSRARNAIDPFILERLDAAELQPAPEADRRTLIRRLSLDLIGLPPTLEEVAAFVDDPRPDAYERLVDRLLASPGYGERWGKFWLDAAGYADSNGYFSADSDRPLAYRYRDWVARAVNADMPFDEFIRLQIAGDELLGAKPGAEVTPAIADALAATHFLRNGQDGTGESDGNPDEVRADRYSVLEGAVQIVGSALLGLTVQCARCHDHKFEPITQADYYSLQAVLLPAFPVDQWVKPNDRVVHAAPTAEQKRWETETKQLDTAIAGVRTTLRAWSQAHPEPSVSRFADPFDASLETRWRGLTTGGRTAPRLDSGQAPAAQVKDGALRVVEAGEPSGRRLVTRSTFDWSPDAEGQWIEATFRLVALTVDGGKPAERVGYYVAATDDLNDSSRGNILIDGDPNAAGSAVDRGYPGPKPKRLGVLGVSKYEAGHTYGVRVTNAGGGKFQVEHVVDGEPEDRALTLRAAELPDGGFGFEYCCGRSFVVDDVAVRVSDPSLDPSRRATEAKQREAKRKEAEEAARALEAKRRPRPGLTAWVTDVAEKPPIGHLLKRGNYNDPGPAVDPRGPAVLSDGDNPFDVRPPVPGGKSTGRREALARWLTRPGSRPAALLARVTVNRVWQHHFGAGLVATPENLGYASPSPSHPALLEWLADEFVASGWGLRALHRRIVESAAYRRGSSAPDPPRVSKVDPDNRLLGHYPPRRLDAEAVRDAMLVVSGELDRTGPGPYVPTSRRADGEVVVDESAAGGRRRSLYLQQRRTQVATLLEVFDAPSIVTSCPKRAVSTIPLQSLSLLNSGFATARAAAFARRLEREIVTHTDLDARIDRAFELAAGRPPDAPEREAARTFLRDQPARYPNLPPAEAARKALADFCQMLLASNAFLYVE